MNTVSPAVAKLSAYFIVATGSNKCVPVFASLPF